MTQPTEPPNSKLPAERVGRGIALAVIALPLGVAVWLLLWGIGFVSSIIALGISLAALALYRSGSGGRVGWVGASVITAITAIAITATLLSGALLYSELTTPDTAAELILSAVLAVVFGGLGCVVAWRIAVVQSQAARPSTRIPLPGIDPDPR